MDIIGVCCCWLSRIMNAGKGSSALFMYAVALCQTLDLCIPCTGKFIYFFYVCTVFLFSPPKKADTHVKFCFLFFALNGRKRFKKKKIARSVRSRVTIYSRSPSSPCLCTKKSTLLRRHTNFSNYIFNPIQKKFDRLKKKWQRRKKLQKGKKKKKFLFN